MLFAWLLNALALALGVGLGARALIDPRWASRFVRLKADDQPGGFAEFRATYGGVFLLFHLCALGLTVRYLQGGGALVGVVATGASAAVAAAPYFSTLRRDGLIGDMRRSSRVVDNEWRG